jgi:hypothetical protein
MSSKKPKNARRTRTKPRPTLSLARPAPAARGAKRSKKLHCRATTKGGQPCSAPPLSGMDRCIMHSGRAAELGSKGGRRRAVFNPTNLEPFRAPQSAGDLMRLVAATIVEVRAAKIDPRSANSIAYLGASFLKAVELVDLDARLKVLEGRRDAAEQ